MNKSDLEKASHYLKDSKPYCDTAATSGLHHAIEHLTAAVEKLANPLVAVEPCPEPENRKPTSDQRKARVLDNLQHVADANGFDSITAAIVAGVKWKESVEPYAKPDLRERMYKVVEYLLDNSRSYRHQKCEGRGRHMAYLHAVSAIRDELER